MLKMKCPRCEEFIVSKLLAEIDNITCEHCHETVPVQEVMVFAKGFTFHRNDLAKRLFRYKSLINEVIQERELLENNVKASPESKKSLDQFLEALKEVMAGARNSLRLEFSEHIPVEFLVNQRAHKGILLNLSTSGACIETSETATIPNKKSQITLQFSLPDRNHLFSLNGIVVWTNKSDKKNHQVYGIGIEFRHLDEAVLQILWEFIANAASVN